MRAAEGERETDDRDRSLLPSLSHTHTHTHTQLLLNSLHLVGPECRSSFLLDSMAGIDATRAAYDSSLSLSLAVPGCHCHHSLPHPLSIQSQVSEFEHAGPPRKTFYTSTAPQLAELDDSQPPDSSASSSSSSSSFVSSNSVGKYQFVPLFNSDDPAIKQVRCHTRTRTRLSLSLGRLVTRHVSHRTSFA